MVPVGKWLAGQAGLAGLADVTPRLKTLSGTLTD